MVIWLNIQYMFEHLPVGLRTRISLLWNPCDDDIFSSKRFSSISGGIWKWSTAFLATSMPDDFIRLRCNKSLRDMWRSPPVQWGYPTGFHSTILGPTISPWESCYVPGCRHCYFLFLIEAIRLVVQGRVVGKSGIKVCPPLLLHHVRQTRSSSIFAVTTSNTYIHSSLVYKHSTQIPWTVSGDYWGYFAASPTSYIGISYPWGLVINLLWAALLTKVGATQYAICTLPSPEPFSLHFPPGRWSPIQRSLALHFRRWVYFVQVSTEKILVRFLP